jgi:hypothetical protein
MGCVNAVMKKRNLLLSLSRRKMASYGRLFAKNERILC